MGVVLVAIALVSGFIFTNLHKPARFRQKRSVGWDSYFHVATWGTLFGGMAAVICVVIDYFNVVSNFFKDRGLPINDLGGLTLHLDDLKLVSWSVGTIVLAALFGYLSKLFYYIFSNSVFKLIARIAEKDHLDSFILEAAATQFPILVTLKSRKCYVGICYGEADGLADAGAVGSHLALLPLLSGFRDSETLSLELTTNYNDHYDSNEIDTGGHERLTLDDFKNVLPKCEIESVSFFDLETYVQFKEMEVQNRPNNVIATSYSIDSVKVDRHGSF
jgi:hypothetical protein